jgi:hypothetical protein
VSHFTWRDAHHCFRPHDSRVQVQVSDSKNRLPVQVCSSFFPGIIMEAGRFVFPSEMLRFVTGSYVLLSVVCCRPILFVTRLKCVNGSFVNYGRYVIGISDNQHPTPKFHYAKVNRVPSLITLMGATRMARKNKNTDELLIKKGFGRVHSMESSSKLHPIINLLVPLWQSCLMHVEGYCNKNVGGL